MEKSALGGALLWALDSDDYNGFCGTPWPLMTTVKTYVSNGKSLTLLNVIIIILNCTDYV